MSAATSAAASAADSLPAASLLAASARDEALLAGTAPTAADPLLTQAYRAGVAAAQGARGAPKAQADVTPRELGALLAPGSRDARLRALAAQALLHVAKEWRASEPAGGGAPTKVEAKLMMHEALAGGEALRGLCGTALACATACEARPEEADELIKATGAERELLSLVLSIDGSKTRALLPAKDALGLKVEDVCVLSDAVSAFVLAAAAAPKERGGLLAEVAAQVTESLSSMRRYVGDLSESFFAYARVVATGGPAVLRASFRLLARFPKSSFARTISLFFMSGANSGDFNDAFLHADASSVSSLLDAISSTTHDDDTLRGLISAISNVCGMEGAAGDTASRAFAEGRVFSFLQPPLLSSNSFIVSRTAFAIATLARREVLYEYVEKAELTPVLLDVLHALPYGAVKGNSIWGRADAANLAALLTASTHPELQLSVLHEMASAVVGSATAENINFFAKTPAILAGLRVAASSGDAFVYSGAAFVLHHMTEAVPVYRQRAAEASALAAPAEAWSIESVAAWVAKQPFRAYKRAFAENLITGRVLLTLSEEDLANTLGVTNAVRAAPLPRMRPASTPSARSYRVALAAAAPPHHPLRHRGPRRRAPRPRACAQPR
jgi:hypothetical protein